MNVLDSLIVQSETYVDTMGTYYSSWELGIPSVVLAIAASVVIIVIYVLLAHFKGMRLSKRAAKVCGVLSIANLIVLVVAWIGVALWTPAKDLDALNQYYTELKIIMFAGPFVLMNVILGSASFVSAARGKERAPSTGSPVLGVLCAFVYELFVVVLPIVIVLSLVLGMPW